MEPSVAISGHQRTCGTVIICGHHHVARRGEYRLEDHRRLELGRDHTMLIGQDALAVSARCDLERPILEGRRVDGNRDGDMSRCELVRRVRRRILEQIEAGPSERLSDAINGNPATDRHLMQKEAAAARPLVIHLILEEHRRLSKCLAHTVLHDAEAKLCPRGLVIAKVFDAADAHRAVVGGSFVVYHPRVLARLGALARGQRGELVRHGREPRSHLMRNAIR